MASVPRNLRRSILMSGAPRLSKPYIHFLRQKSKAFSAYKDFEAWSQTQHGARVKTLHSDRGGEYRARYTPA